MWYCFFEVTLVTVFWGYIFVPRLSFVIALSCEKVILICVAMVGFISCQTWQCQAEFGFSFIQWNWIQFIVHKRLSRGCHLAFFDDIYFSQWQHYTLSVWMMHAVCSRVNCTVVESPRIGKAHAYDWLHWTQYTRMWMMIVMIIA